MEKVYKIAPKDSTYISSEKQRQIVRLLAKTYRIKTSFVADDKINAVAVGGLETSREDSYIKIQKSAPAPLDCFLHELGHVYCLENRIFPEYHCTQLKKGRFDTPYNRRVIKGWLKWAWKAECFVDSVAGGVKKLFFPNFPYKAYYTKDYEKEGKAWIKEFYKKQYKL